MSNWRTLADTAAVMVAAAEHYRKAEVLRTAAERLEEAAAILRQAALIRSTEIGEKS